MTIFEKCFVSLNKKFLSLYWTYKNKYSSTPGVSKDSDYIISLTTFPPRLHICYLTIESLLDQKLRPAKIILWLSKDQIKLSDLPDTLKRQERRGLEIRFVDDDLKAYKKLVYSMSEFPDYKIVTSDDDVYYPDWWLRELDARQSELPECVICYRAHEMKLNEKGQLANYSQWTKSVSGAPSYRTFPVGVSGVLYKRGFFDDEFFRRDIYMRICKTNDDIWFKAMTLKKGIKCAKVYDKNVIFKTIEGSQDDSLFNVNVLGSQNDVQLKAVFDLYNLYNKIS